MDDKSSKWTMGGGTMVFFIIAFPLWREFREPGEPAWNILLVLMLAGFLAAAYFLQRFFREHIGEIGEARFDTSNKADSDD